MVLRIFILTLLIVVIGCGTIPLDRDKPFYQFDGLIPKVAYDPKPIPPLDLAKERLVIEGYKRLSTGISIALAAFIVTVAFSNRIVDAGGNIGMIVGGYMATDGLLKIFTSMYLVYFVWGAFVLIVLTVAWARRKSIVTFYKNIRNKSNGSICTETNKDKQS